MSGVFSHKMAAKLRHKTSTVLLSCAYLPRLRAAGCSDATSRIFRRRAHRTKSEKARRSGHERANGKATSARRKQTSKWNAHQHQWHRESNKKKKKKKKGFGRT